MRPVVPLEERHRRVLSGATKAVVAARYGLQVNAGWTPVDCHWCGSVGKAAWSMWEGQRVGSVSLWGMEWDHVLALSRGGMDTPGNLVIACCRCNRSKGNRDAPSWLKEVG